MTAFLPVDLVGSMNEHIQGFIDPYAVESVLPVQHDDKPKAHIIMRSGSVVAVHGKAMELVDTVAAVTSGGESTTLSHIEREGALEERRRIVVFLRLKRQAAWRQPVLDQYDNIADDIREGRHLE